MKQGDMSPRHEQLLVSFASLPEKMLALYDLENLVEFVLHELCTTRCFNLSKAAYFIDNVDFDCFKGLAGFDKSNEFIKSEESWDTPQEFTQHMQGCKFNQKVRSISNVSPKKSSCSQQQFINELASELEIVRPATCAWDLKHDNYGILIYETAGHQAVDKHLFKALSLLGFCPVF
ncbi:hypothetical protein H0X48_05290 [Candidatus Dependentiae bacterium]|nr:hypothetical protein [Candidatus Dependentiae bacterium]